MKYLLAGLIVLVFFLKILGLRVTQALTSIGFYGMIFYLLGPFFWAYMFYISM